MTNLVRRTPRTRKPAALALSLVVALPLALASLVSGAAGSSAADTYTVTSKGESYGPGAAQNVTVYRPSATGKRPVAYFVHGGGWSAGGRAAWADQAYQWATHGWVTINIDYTKAVNSGDGALLLNDITTVVNKYEPAAYVDPTRQVIVGDSAGGHLATTIGAKLRGHFDGVIAWSPVASPENAAFDGAQPGASDQMASLGIRAKRFFAYSYGTTSAFRYVTAYGGPPMWIAGSADEWVTWSRQGGALCDTLVAIGPTLCEKHVVPGTLHGTDIRDANAALADSAYSFAMHRIGAWT